MLFRRAAVERLEPMREMRRPSGDGPFLHGLRDFVGDFRIEGGFARNGRKKFDGRFLGKKTADGGFAEDVLRIMFQRRGGRGHGGACPQVGDGVDGMFAFAAAHGCFTSKTPQ